MIFGYGSAREPKRDEYPDTPEGFHRWARDTRAWNDDQGITSDGLVKKWNEQRKNS